jgi:hypothetical protein
VRTRDLLGAAGMLLVAVPVSVFATLLLLPLWRWIEGSLQVESVGHSGPAGWCFLATYVVVTGAGAVWSRRTRRD